MLLSSVQADFLLQFRQAFTSSVFEVFAEPFTFGIVVFGMGTLYLWLLLFGGWGALDRAPVRRTAVNPFAALLLIFAWMLIISAAGSLIDRWLEGTAEELTGYIFSAVFEITAVILLLTLSRRVFARRLKGIGLNPLTLGRDLGWAPVNLLAVYPLVLLGLWFVLFAGRFVEGAQYAVEKHQSLQTLSAGDNPLLQWLIPVFAVFIVPVFEELLFRGFVQSSIAARTGRPWLAIAATSLLFTVAHLNWQHWLGLFILSCGFGYAYERSGSLFRPIIMHMLFNAINISAVLLQQFLQNA